MALTYQDIQQLGFEADLVRYLDQVGFPCYFALEDDRDTSEWQWNEDDVRERLDRFLADTPCDDAEEAHGALVSLLHGNQLFRSLDEDAATVTDKLTWEMKHYFNEMIDYVGFGKREKLLDLCDYMTYRVTDAPFEYEILLRWGLTEVYKCDHEAVMEAPVCQYKKLLLDAKDAGVPLSAVMEMSANWDDIERAHTQHGIPLGDLFAGYGN